MTATTENKLPLAPLEQFAVIARMRAKMKSQKIHPCGPKARDSKAIGLALGLSEPEIKRCQQSASKFALRISQMKEDGASQRVILRKVHEPHDERLAILAAKLWSELRVRALEDAA